jgi:hypothetical protein
MGSSQLTHSLSPQSERTALRQLDMDAEIGTPQGQHKAGVVRFSFLSFSFLPAGSQHQHREKARGPKEKMIDPGSCEVRWKKILAPPRLQIDKLAQSWLSFR